MARRSQPADPEALLHVLAPLIEELPARLKSPAIGERVGHLVLIQRVMRDLGASIGADLDRGNATSGRARVLAYLRAQVGRIVHTEELMIVAGIGDYARRIRELRTEEGWPIVSGAAMRDIRDDLIRRGHVRAAPPSMAVEEYILVEDARDEDAIRRWELAGRLKNEQRPVAHLIHDYLRASLGRRVTAEELRLVANNSAAWIDALSQLVAGGLPLRGYGAVATDLACGLYVLEARNAD